MRLIAVGDIHGCLGQLETLMRDVAETFVLKNEVFFI